MKKHLFALLLTVLAHQGFAASAPQHVEMISRPNGTSLTWTLAGVNGRKLLCPDTKAYANSCVVDRVIAPADCDWECQDGVLSGQGRSLFRGVFALETLDKSVTRVFRIEAAWDTWRNTAIRGPLYRIRPEGSAYSLEQVDRQKKARVLTALDFSKTDDVNFQLEPSRADDMLAGSEGILVTGQVQGSRFRIDQIWRQWSPRLTCDVWSIARARAFPADSDALTMIFGTEEEATSYAAPEGQTVRWLIWEREDAGAVVFRSGINDLWAEVFSVGTRDCAITTLAEH